MSSPRFTAALAALALIATGCASPKDGAAPETGAVPQATEAAEPAPAPEPAAAPASQPSPASQPADAPASQPSPASQPADAPASQPSPAFQPAAGGAEAFDAAMAAVVEPYLRMQDALARDSTDGVADAAKALVTAAAKLDPKAVTGEHAGHYTDVPAKLKAGAEAVAAAADLAAARTAFKTLSMPMGMWATMARPADLDLVYCPMVKAGWVQKPGAIRNPYHGSEMLACGEVVSGPSKKAQP